MSASASVRAYVAPHYSVRCVLVRSNCVAEERVLKMGDTMKIWDLPRSEEGAIRFFQQKQLCPALKQCANGHDMTLYSFEYNVMYESNENLYFLH